MGIPVGVAWSLTAAFLALAYPCLARLARLDYRRLGAGVRHIDLAGLLMALAMVAMVSPVGAPIPVAGWQAMFLLTAAWFLACALRDRMADGVCRRCDLHHGVAAVAMLYMLTAMPHAGGHGAWPTMVQAGGGSYALPALAVLAAGYFAVDGAHTAAKTVRNLRRRGGHPLPEGAGSRAVCRTVMGIGMAYLFAAGAIGG
ncbi:DUF5134 domain-containing protein [Prauserella muralis]|uniref:DUF5134 domain-containing protein n=1 Tax=Prauserella muralis TaxID=588067 RepID=A0A2V4B4S8_9PSEU|nr:DUF5134 domain-containing protein [Prauserella muralis]PXY28085.1 DUF5134 domain-containing protein [Prauserella muralis]TWE22114.1 uncharacterized protein DUF5134 [Prauserella muralis]